MTPPIEKLLFAAAAGLVDEKEHSAFLDHACKDDPSLRKRLDELLEVQAAADTFFEFQPEVESHVNAAEQAEEEGLGARIGSYRLIKRLGAGGCGVVYLAEQEQPVRRKVALKIIKLGMDTEAVIARFEIERQALAQMDHPNIARVLDAGATASGRPYFVMELVEGERITDFCDANCLDIRQRLELFVQVCRAIQHAHQKGVIHRDIKPSNVLVHWHENVPLPKVIDFGIAKAAAESVTVDVITTTFNQFIGTPAYMSPEQAQGSADVDTRSDIYSLGVLLYELLSSRPPFDFMRLKDYPIDEVRRIVQLEEPKPPSIVMTTLAPEECMTVAANRNTDAARLASQLTDDLDWIVMKAMEKERQRRYDTANGLAMDVIRYLKDEPVSARPRSRVYLLGKLVRRNKLIFTAGSIAVFGLLAGFSISTWMFFRERTARQEQTRLREKAEFREHIAHAAVRIKYSDLAGADKLLAEVPIEQTPSSLEAAEAFGAVADWHVHTGRLKEAALRFTSMVKAISSVDDSDLPSVSFDLLPVAATVAYTEGADRYEEIRRMAIARFRTTSNPIVAEQTLKACILLPADKKTLQSLERLAGVVEHAIESRAGPIGTDPHNTAWACFAMSLWNYRISEFSKAASWAERCLDYPNKNEARTATFLIVRAMIEQQSGQSEKARASLAQARDTVHDAFSSKTWMTTTWPGRIGGQVFWFDWINASLLLNEAERLIGNKQS